MLSLNKPLILASQSEARKKMLCNAGLDFKSFPAAINEDKLLKEMKDCGEDHFRIVQNLADQKALYVSEDYPESYVIGSDQILCLDDRIFQKANSREEAREKLKALSGLTHKLISAGSVAMNGQIIWQDQGVAMLTMKQLSAKGLDHYCAAAGEALTRSVGSYEIESLGAWLFSKVEGDMFTIMGMPLLSLLSFLATLADEDE